MRRLLRLLALGRMAEQALLLDRGETMRLVRFGRNWALIIDESFPMAVTASQARLLRRYLGGV